MRVLVLLILTGWSMLAQVPNDLDLFLLIGQSNMAGRGVIGTEERKPIPGIWVLAQDLTWKPAVDPLHYDKPQIVGAGLGRPFAQALFQTHPGKQIGLIPAAFGGSALDEWKRGTEHYNEAIRRTKAALHNGRLRGILWHQGEADSSRQDLANTYLQRFDVMIRQLRADLGDPNVPVIVGELGRFYRNRPKEGAKYADIVVQQLQLIPGRVPRSAFVSAEGLTDKGDQTHFDTQSLHELGKRYAVAYRKLEGK